MPALNLRDERLLARALDAAAEELDLPLTTRQVRALARAAARRLGEVAAERPPVPGGFRQPTLAAEVSGASAPSRPSTAPESAELPAPGQSRARTRHSAPQSLA